MQTSTTAKSQIGSVLNEEGAILTGGMGLFRPFADRQVYRVDWVTADLLRYRTAVPTIALEAANRLP